MGEVIRFPIEQRGISASLASPKKRDVAAEFHGHINAIRDQREEWGLDDLPEYEGHVQKQLADLALAICNFVVDDGEKETWKFVEMLKTYKKLRGLED